MCISMSVWGRYGKKSENRSDNKWPKKKQWNKCQMEKGKKLYALSNII